MFSPRKFILCEEKDSPRYAGTLNLFLIMLGDEIGGGIGGAKRPTASKKALES